MSELYMKRGFDYQKSIEGRPEEALQMVEGIPIPIGMKDVNFSDLQTKFTVRSTDVFIASYLKSGSTWLMQILKLIRNNGMEDGVEVSQAIPLVEWVTTEEAEAMTSPRTFRSHFPYHIFFGGEPATTPAKYIYIYRNPKDTAVSLYHFQTGFQFSQPLPWDMFFEVWLQGSRLGYGSMLDHVAGWWKHKDAKNILVVNYESMKKDLPQVIKTIADFLGCHLSPEIITKISEQTTFATMKKNPSANCEFIDIGYRRKESTPFLRKGVVGDWKNHFTAEQSTRMDEECTKRFAGSGLEFDYGH